jgi:serine kinase of HPr protein (carbohydrate metabolism regulator)
MTAPATVHASAVLTGDIGILICGPSGAGKSRLAFDLILAGLSGQLPQTRLVGDDRVLLSTEDGRVTVRPAAELEGLIEVRGLGIRRCDFVPQATLGLVVDLAAADAARMPEQNAMVATFNGIKIPRVPVRTGFEPLPLVAAALLTSPAPETLPAAFRRLPEGDW